MGMPWRQKPELRLSTSDARSTTTPTSNSTENTANPSASANIATTMATQVRMPTHSSVSPHISSSRIHLPPIYPPSNPQYAPSHHSRPESAHSYGTDQYRNLPYAQPRTQQPQSQILRYGQPQPDEPLSIRSPARSMSSSSPSLMPSVSSPRNFGEPSLGRKRSYDQTLSENDRPRSDVPPMFSPLRAENATDYPRSLLPPYTAPTRSPSSMVSTPSSVEPGTYRLGHPWVTSRHALPVPEPPGSRFRLHVRQQPRAARAGPDGKDRRTIDPPPVLQLQIEDFDPGSARDMEDLKTPHFVVHCRLVSASSPRQDMSVLNVTSEDTQSGVQRLLLGTNVSNPFFCGDDPDLDTAPDPIYSTPSSPSARLMMRPAAMAPPTEKKARTSASRKMIPGSFFIFADLSVRKAGEYRLEFKLMKMDPTYLVTGMRVPVLHSVVSEVFRVVNAKDFDQVQPSTKLVRGLLDRGAGFPLKLKKGPREGQRTRPRPGSEGDADEAEEEEDTGDG